MSTATRQSTSPVKSHDDKPKHASKSLSTPSSSSSTTTATQRKDHGNAKEDGVVKKQKIAKENRMHLIDEKKSDKKHSTTAPKSKASSSVKQAGEKKHESKSKVETKFNAVQNGKLVEKVVASTEKTNKKPVSIENVEVKRPKDKIKTSNSSELKATKAVKQIEPVSKQELEIKPERRQSTEKVSKQTLPLKAAHDAAISTKNVMNLVHNVTVQSPPPMRREMALVEVKVEEPRKLQPEQSIQRTRTRTRTLHDNEIVLLKPNPTNVSMMTTTNQNGSPPNQTENASVEIKPSISFEVSLNENNDAKIKTHAKKIEHTAEKVKSAVEGEKSTIIKPSEMKAACVVTNKSDNESDHYEDDFESYESDFETDVSNDEEEREQNENDENEERTISSGESDTDENVVSTASRHPFETGHSIENSEFDSGSFEMKVLSARSRARNQTDSGTKGGRYDQNDSGIENCSHTAGVNTVLTVHNGQMNSLEMNNKTFDNISDIEIEGAISLDTNHTSPKKANNASGKVAKTKPKSWLQKRGEELLSKITLDVMNYVLFDFKPIPYELFMKIYGNSNTTQVAVQTHNDRIDQECQSDAITMQTSWTQYPITYYTKHMSLPNYVDYKNGCGMVTDEQKTESTDENLNKTCENSLNLIRKMAEITGTKDVSRAEYGNIGIVNIDYNSLNRFLLESEMTLSRILNIHIRKRFRSLNESMLPISRGFFTLRPTFDGNFANEKVLQVFATESLPGFLFTLHYDKLSQLNVLALWNLSKLSQPVCLLSVWSNILCIEIHPKIRDNIFAGLDDGSIAVWDYSESKYWQPNLSRTDKRFVPSQITTPTYDTTDLIDFGRCIALRGLPIATDTELLNGYNPKQICSLHECGLLILWTVLCNTTSVYTDLLNKRIEHHSLWSKVKLIQNKVIDLRASISQMLKLKMTRPTSKSFDKTRSYFESELFDDAALQELHNMNADENKLLTTFRCTAIELTTEGILISTNENFLLFGRKSFKNESFRRIQIDPCKSVRVECMLSLSDFDDDIVIIALNNGAVKSLCCDQNFDQLDDLQANSDIEESSSSISSLTHTAGGNGKAAQLIDCLPFTEAPASNGPVQVVMASPLQATTGFFADGNSSSVGKSCTIQSLVLNERKIYDEAQALHHLENIEYKGSIDIASNKFALKSMRCSQLMSGQTIFNNSIDVFSSTVCRQYLVHLVKSKKLITLRKNRLHIYDFLTNQTIEMPSDMMTDTKFIDAKTITANHNEEYLILLNGDGIVELHQIVDDPDNC